MAAGARGIGSPLASSNMSGSASPPFSRVGVLLVVDLVDDDGHGQDEAGVNVLWNHFSRA